MQNIPKHMSSALPAPSRDRLSELFVTLARIGSPSRKERAVADIVLSVLRQIGVAAVEDDTGSVIEGDCGNITCVVGDQGAKPLLALGAHMDTVMPSGPIEPVMDSRGRFTNAADTILGADDKAAIAALLHAAELLVQSGSRFACFELFFTVCEEDGLVGAKHLATDALSSRQAVVLDSSGPVGGIVVGAPSQKIVRARFKGVAAHAGLEPELGRSAVQAAAKAVASMELGRLDEETTANIGTIHGGVATNIVPDACEVAGECRGHDEKRLAGVAGAMVDALHTAAAETGVDVQVDLVDEFRAFRLTEDSAIVGLASRAVSGLGLHPTLQIAGGGSDANVLNARGIPTVNLSAGMMRVHSAEEYVDQEELERLCELVLLLIDGAGREAADSDASGAAR